MRKSFILMLSALVLTFTSCKKTNNTDDTETEKSCLISDFMESDGPSAKYTYSTDGKILSYSYTSNDANNPYEIEDKYTYTATKITRTWFNNNKTGTSQGTTIYNLDNSGKIVSTTTPLGTDYTYEYNQDGYLIKISTVTSTGVTMTSTISWVNGNPVQYKNFSDETYSISFNSEGFPKNLYIQNSVIPYELCFELRNFFGKAVKNLPISAKSIINAYEYTYSKDNNGNIKTISEKFPYNNSTLITTFNYSCK